jgi:hypothetical protein
VWITRIAAVRTEPRPTALSDALASSPFSRLMSRRHRWMGSRVSAIKFDGVEAGFASSFGVVNWTGRLDLLSIRRDRVRSGDIPSDTGIHAPGVDLDPLITVTGEVVVPVLSSAKKQGGPPRTITLILENEGTCGVTVNIASGRTHDLSRFNRFPWLIVFN